jgi:Zn-dependent protease with chaperone function
MSAQTFDFQSFIDLRKSPTSRRTQLGGFGEYAFSEDVRVLRTLAYARPVRLAVEASVRAFKAWSRSDLLGSSVRVSPRQFPRVYDITAECAQELHIPMPTVYISQNNATINAGTYGTENDSFILINSLTVDRLSDDELRFVIGHECGHIQNSHVTYSTALHFLTHATGMFLSWIVTPATLALRAWSRRAEITCDRAGMICCKDAEVGLRTLVKLAGGTERMLEQIDIEDYLRQLDDIRNSGLGRISEYLLSHPYLPKRVRALQLFAESDYFLRHVGQAGGRPLPDVDRDVKALISVL